MDKEKSFVLSNGLSIPAIGYGTGIAMGYSKLSKSQLLVKLAVEKARNIVHGTSSKNSNYSVKKDLKKDRSLREVTEAAVNLGSALADLNYKVLLIDFDAQCNLTGAVSGDLRKANI